jgi:hypothetical protein
LTSREGERGRGQEQCDDMAKFSDTVNKKNWVKWLLKKRGEERISVG